ncbi:MAG: hypothetical protein AAFU79_22380 [Myxococcota bacterium]
MRVDRDTFEHRRKEPIVRDKLNAELFGQINPPGAEATYFEINPDVWEHLLASSIELDAPDEEASAFEGEVRRYFTTHRRREASLRDRNIREGIAESPDKKLRCEVVGCGFCFDQVYGEIGKDCAEIHHPIPLPRGPERPVSRT